MAILLFSWFIYFVIHSLLASLIFKTWMTRHFPHVMPFYRLTYNILAIVLLLPLLLLSLQLPQTLLWQLPPRWFFNGLAILAIVGFWLSLKYYDTAEFLGLTQIQQQSHRVDSQENFVISPFHRFVRHPWYFFFLVIIWTRDMTDVSLVSSLMISGYLIVGSHLEDKKLIIFYGETYREYKQQVAGLFPLPWKFKR
jgi:methanethiol S-methyltransferase